MTAGGSDPGAAAPAPRPPTCTVRDGPVDDSGGARGATAGTAFPVPGGTPVLHAMIRAAQRCLPVGCRGGGCGACRVRVLTGSYTTRRMSRRHVSPADEAEQIVLACRLLPSTDIVVERAPAPAVVPEAGPPAADSP